VPRRHRRRARRVRCPGRGVPRERRVRDGEGGRAARLDRRTRGRAGAPARDQARGRRSRADLLRARRRRATGLTPSMSYRDLIDTSDDHEHDPAVDHDAEWLARADAVIPGGVNSPVRAFGAVGGHPFFVARGTGAWLQDTNGRRYIDYVQSWGASIPGHANPAIVDAVRRAAVDGTSFGAPTAREVELAEAICERVPSVEKLRLVSSGTEAAMTAVRLARGATGRAKIVKFAGCYHGHADALLVAAGSGVATLGLPDSAGVT